MRRLLFITCLAVLLGFLPSSMSAGSPHLKISPSAPQLGAATQSKPSTLTRTQSLPTHFDHDSPQSQKRNRRLKDLADRRKGQRKPDTRAVVFQGLRESVEAALAAMRGVLSQAQDCQRERIARLKEHASANPEARSDIDRAYDMARTPLRKRYESEDTKALAWMDRLRHLRQTEAEHEWFDQAERHLQRAHADCFRVFEFSHFFPDLQIVFP